MEKSVMSENFTQGSRVGEKARTFINGDCVDSSVEGRIVGRYTTSAIFANLSPPCNM